MGENGRFEYLLMPSYPNFTKPRQIDDLPPWIGIPPTNPTPIRPTTPKPRTQTPTAYSHLNTVIQYKTVFFLCKSCSFPVTRDLVRNGVISCKQRSPNRTAFIFPVTAVVLCEHCSHPQHTVFMHRTLFTPINSVHSPQLYSLRGI